MSCKNRLGNSRGFTNTRRPTPGCRKIEQNRQNGEIGSWRTGASSAPCSESGPKDPTQEGKPRHRFAGAALSSSSPCGEQTGSSGRQGALERSGGLVLLLRCLPPLVVRERGLCEEPAISVVGLTFFMWIVFAYHTFNTKKNRRCTSTRAAVTVKYLEIYPQLGDPVHESHQLRLANSMGNIAQMTQTLRALDTPEPDLIKRLNDVVKRLECATPSDFGNYAIYLHIYLHTSMYEELKSNRREA
ncbi:hypothetical protein C8J57DRAFT_1236265 [Mycena rebaudengoi]|nr:hypothetical protein C8J57DRAFT_1236265 [Mycena rebaudengoi]